MTNCLVSFINSLQNVEIRRVPPPITDNSYIPHSGKQILNQQQQKDKKRKSSRLFSPEERREKGFPLSANQSGCDNGSHAWLSTGGVKASRDPAPRAQGPKPFLE